MKKSTKVVLLTAITMTLCGCRSCHPCNVYGPAPDVVDVSNDVSKEMIIKPSETEITEDENGNAKEE